MMKLIVIILVLGIGITSYFLGGSEPEHEVIFTASAPMPIGPYSQAIKVGNTLYVSGQVGMTVAEKMDTASIEAEVMQALKNVEAIVTMAGMEMKHVVKSTLYVKDLKNFAKINEVYKLYFPLDPPARETVQVNGLPRNAHFEISVVAVK
jgi:2-iminobutanoate/2-iminopropanoate deaminase